MQGAKEACTARDCCAHEVEFPEEALLSFDAYVPFVSQVGEDLKHTYFPMVSKFHGASVEFPAQDFFALGPTAIPFQHLLFRHGFFPIGGVGSACAKMQLTACRMQ